MNETRLNEFSSPSPLNVGNFTSLIYVISPATRAEASMKIDGVTYYTHQLDTWYQTNQSNLPGFIPNIVNASSIPFTSGPAQKAAFWKSDISSGQQMLWNPLVINQSMIDAGFSLIVTIFLGINNLLIPALNATNNEKYLSYSPPGGYGGLYDLQGNGWIDGHTRFAPIIHLPTDSVFCEIYYISFPKEHYPGNLNVGGGDYSNSWRMWFGVFYLGSSPDVVQFAQATPELIGNWTGSFPSYSDIHEMHLNSFNNSQIDFMWNFNYPIVTNFTRLSQVGESYECLLGTGKDLYFAQEFLVPYYLDSVIQIS